MTNGGHNYAADLFVLNEILMEHQSMCENQYRSLFNYHLRDEIGFHIIVRSRDELNDRHRRLLEINSRKQV